MERRFPTWCAWLFVGLVLGLHGAVVAQEPPPTPEPEESTVDDRLVCIGALAGAHIYTTYGYVGGVADAYANDVYDADRVNSLMKETIGLADVSIAQLKKVRDGNITEEDKQVINDVIEIYGLLKKESQSLSDYTTSGAQADLDAFESARTAAWPKIKKVLGIKE